MIVCVIDFPTVTAAYFGSCFTDISLDLTAPLLWSYQSYPYFIVIFPVLLVCLYLVISQRFLDSMNMFALKFFFVFRALWAVTNTVFGVETSSS